MTTAKRDLTDPRVQGSRVLDLRDDIVSIEDSQDRSGIQRRDGEGVSE
jgi:hypothetical protein